MQKEIDFTDNEIKRMENEEQDSDQNREDEIDMLGT